MPRSRVPIRGSIGKSILTGQKSTVVQQTIVQQVVKGSTSGVGAVAATIWPLISQIPINVSDLAALTTAGIVVDTGSHIIARTLAVNTPLTIANPTGAGGNPTISLTTAALTKIDDTNVTVTLGGTPGSALVAATSLTLGWTGQLAVSRGGTGNSALAALTKTDDTNVTLTLGGAPATALVNAASITVGWTGTLAVSRGGSGAATLTGYLKGNGTSAFTASATIPTGDITGLAAIATSGSASDLATGTVPSARLPTASTSVLGAVKVDGTTITVSGGVISVDEVSDYTWSGAQSFTGLSPNSVSTSYASLGTLAGPATGYPGFTFNAHGAPTDQKFWNMYIDEGDGSFSLRAGDDTAINFNYPIIIRRSGITITGIFLSGPLHIGTVGLFGNPPTTQVTGWGTPTGASVVANFPGGSASLLQCSTAIAKIVADLEALGLYAA